MEVCRHSFMHSSPDVPPEHFNQVEVWTLTLDFFLNLSLYCHSTMEEEEKEVDKEDWHMHSKYIYLIARQLPSLLLWGQYLVFHKTLCRPVKSFYVFKKKKISAASVAQMPKFLLKVLKMWIFSYKKNTLMVLFIVILDCWLSGCTCGFGLCLFTWFGGNNKET